ncbi:hypothetical protein [Shinella pollutisoli]|uniref:F5/8 type C domain-containing protein n=1 Tax=Shinella pollutisoli TaxID=2250594 RepID=A0ABV7DIF1_9HYPH|nr:hypothetical protein [Shinella pollutisoli]
MPAAVVFENLADAASVRASSSILLAQPTLVQQVHVERRWRALNNVAWLVLDLGAETPIDTVAAMGLTATAARVRVSVADPSGAAGELFDSGQLTVDQAYLALVVLSEAPVSGRYVRIDLSNEGAPYVEAGRVCIGLRSTFAYNFDYGWSYGYVDPSTRSKTRGGQTQVTPRRPYRTIDVTFPRVTAADRYSFVETIERENALQRDVLFTTDPESDNLARDTIWGLMSETTAIVQPFIEDFTKQYRIEERR